MYASDIKHSSKSLGEKLAHIYTLGRKTINLSHRPPFLELLEAFGNPHKNLPPVIHVAGTNGKGSIVATLRSILQAQGYKVHAYTSPHLCDFNERIVLAGDYIADDFLESLIDEAIVLNNDNDVTFFEITTAIAFAAFARVPADVVLLEVGLGGRQDCTNIIEKPLVSIISSIAYDHMEWLGDSLAQIAAEKGGIIKQNVPCVVGRQNMDSENKIILETLEKIAAQKGSTLARHGAEWFTQGNGDLFNFVYKNVEMTLTRPSLCGSHQIANTGAALAALKIIEDQLPVSQGAIETGLQNIRWAGRLQNLTKDSGKLPSGWELWLDGGHNEDAAKILAQQAQQWQREDGKPLHLILGMMNHKTPGEFLAPLLPHIATLSFTGIPGEPKAYSAAELARLVPPHPPRSRGGRSGGKSQENPPPFFTGGQGGDDFSAAIKTLTQTSPPGRILICGSLYLVGHVLKSLGVQP